MELRHEVVVLRNYIMKPLQRKRCFKCGREGHLARACCVIKDSPASASTANDSAETLPATSSPVPTAPPVVDTRVEEPCVRSSAQPDPPVRPATQAPAHSSSAPVPVSSSCRSTSWPNQGPDAPWRKKPRDCAGGCGIVLHLGGTPDPDGEWIRCKKCAKKFRAASKKGT